MTLLKSSLRAQAGSGAELSLRDEGRPHMGLQGGAKARPPPPWVCPLGNTAAPGLSGTMDDLA